jgi:NTP pyrophosphatase (non-canonical NTP hydrolase)
MNEMQKLIEEIEAFRAERDWKQYHKPKDLAISLALEAAEVLEHFLFIKALRPESFARSGAVG